MIIRIIATALIQCTMRTQRGCIALVVTAGTARSWLAVTLDMAHPCRILASYYTPGTGISLLPCRPSRRCWQAWRSQKSEPGCPGSSFAHPKGDWIRTRAVLRRGHQHGVDHMDHAVRLVDVR